MTDLFLTGYEPMTDRDDTSPHCSCGSGDVSAARVSNEARIARF